MMDDPNRPRKKPQHFQWRVLIGLAGDFYRSEKKNGSERFHWFPYQPSGPISFHPPAIQRPIILIGDTDEHTNI